MSTLRSGSRASASAVAATALAVVAFGALLALWRGDGLTVDVPWAPAWDLRDWVLVSRLHRDPFRWRPCVPWNSSSRQLI